jgi:lipopolysaccharide export LptBFGC system permease protein LptF
VEKSFEGEEDCDIEEVKVEFLDSGFPDRKESQDRLSIYEKREVDNSVRQKRLWRCFVLPITVIVLCCLGLSIVLGFIQLFRFEINN